VKGHATFESANSISVSKTEGGTESISFEKAMICTGSEPSPFPGIPFDEKIIVSSTGALSLEKVPEKLTIVGAGVIGLDWEASIRDWELRSLSLSSWIESVPGSISKLPNPFRRFCRSKA